MSHDALRRSLVKAALAVVLAPASLRAAAAPFAALEERAGGRLGVALFDADDGRSLGHRADERFGLCSTFKLLLAAMVLREADAGRLALDQRLAFGEQDLLANSPVTARHAAAGSMRIDALAQATQTTSDNLAANLLMRRLGGPAALTARLREIGDADTRLDRYEPEMNRVPPGEVRDTSTPRAFAATVARIFGEGVLAPASRERLREWVIATRTGARRLRAGLPADWVVGDKTGTGYAPGMPNKTHDVAIVFRPGRAPLVIAAFYEAPGYFDRMRAEDEAVLAEVGRMAAAWAAT